jgi:hypothetical protein
MKERFLDDREVKLKRLQQKPTFVWFLSSSLPITRIIFGAEFNDGALLMER